MTSSHIAIQSFLRPSGENLEYMLIMIFEELYTFIAMVRMLMGESVYSGYSKFVKAPDYRRKAKKEAGIV
jgi:hypothetical protein